MFLLIYLSNIIEKAYCYIYFCRFKSQSSVLVSSKQISIALEKGMLE